MSKEIKEKCKECVYYNEKQQYPNIEGATTHLNCLSLKCQYRKVTKDLKIARLENKIADLEAKLAEKEEQLAEYSDINNVLNSGLKDKCICCEEEHNQDKISFCIERLEKVRDSVLDFSNGYWIHFVKNGEEYMLSSDLESCLEEYIDNQIEEIKKGE